MLLSAASGIFARYGYQKTTVDDLAKSAGKGKSTFYYYYKSKEEIFRDVIEKEAQILRMKLIESISIKGDALKKMKNYVITRLSSFDSLVNFYSALRDEALEHFDFIENIRSKYDAEQVNIIKMIFLEGIKNNVIELEDIDMAAESLAVVLKGLEYHLIFDKNSERVNEQRINKIIDLIFKGLAKK
ncbi:MAG: TetR/AcrR family transcriptional regulator [Bacteroidales bacterium]|nr:TetR/AcrR family transcriptional regulator [Bacteroidales bacterium]